MTNPAKSRVLPTSQRADLAWTILVVARFLLTISPGYIHPDEFFQSVEPVAARVGGLDAIMPWEFNAFSPIRSWLPPCVLTGLPLFLVRHWTSLATNTMAILGLIRLPSCAISLTMDFALAQICRSRSAHSKDTLLLLHASAWPTLVFGSRTFSNTIEASLFALVLMVALDCRKPSALLGKCLVLGSLLSVGCWVRFTFVVYWIPVGIRFVATSPMPWTSSAGAMVLAAVVVSSMLLSAECYFAGGVCISRPWQCIAPLNAIAYNTDPQNLASHGLHPRLTHMLVNLPLLFGPLAFAFMAELPSILIGAVRAPVTMSFQRASSERQMLLGAVVAPLAVLSLVPHQEARFLLPLQTPLVLLYGETIRAHKRRAYLFTWCIFHLMLVLFFGFAHQGGVVRALAHVRARAAASSGSSHAVVLFSHTYMPPRALLAQPTWPPPAINVLDLMSGGGPCAVLAALRHELRDRWHSGLSLRVALPAPFAHTVRTRSESGDCPRHAAHRLAWSLRWPTCLNFAIERNLWPHWSSEAMPRSLDEAALQVYVITAARGMSCRRSSRKQLPA